MINANQIDQLTGATMKDQSGSKIGKIGGIYLDDQTGDPAWATVNTGMFGTSESFVPIATADMSGGDLTVPFDKDKVKDAPNVAADGHISPAEEQDLYRYYGMDYGMGTDTDTSNRDRTDTDRDRTDTDRDRTDTSNDRTVGHDTSGPTTDQAMTRSEEQLKVGTETREAGRARLRKHVVTENETVTVPVSREEVRVEREPITDANAGNAMDGPAISEEEHEVILHEERPVVDKEVIPVERVKLDTETVTENVQVSEQVQKERIETDGDVDVRGEQSKRNN